MDGTAEVLAAGTIAAQRFRLVRKLGSGAAGAVWLAQDTRLDHEPVACKFLNERFANDRRAVADLKREVLLTRKLRHPHILAVYTFWETDADPLRFITMEYVEGHTLADVVAQRAGPCSVAEVLGWLEGLAAALDYAHSQQVLHRDVKPGNILVAKDGRALLVDFGIARTIRETCRRLAGHVTSGTLMFMSPEQLQGGTLDGRSDLYSLASTVYTLFSGTPPFHHGSIAAQVQLKPAPPIGGLPQPVNAVLLRALAKNPEKRYASCAAFVNALADADAAKTTAPIPADTARSESVDASSTTVQIPVRPIETPWLRIGDTLIEAGLVSARQIEEALNTQRQSSAKLGTVLVKLGYATAQDIAQALAKQLDIPFASLGAERFDPEALALVPETAARAGKFIPVRISGDCTIVAMADPLDLVTMADIEEACPGAVELRIAAEADILAAIAANYPHPAE